MTTHWKPERTLQIVAGTPPGGGLDRVARAVAKAIVATGASEFPVEVLNVPGDGARRAWTHCMDRYPGDAHVVCVSSPNLTTDFLAGTADFEHSRYTPIATLVTEYIAFAVRADSDLRDGAELLDRLGRNPAAVAVALSTALGNPNHLALAQLTRHAGGNVGAPRIRVFDNAVDAVADVVAGTAQVCAVTAASVIPELAAGRVRILGVSAPERLAGSLAGAPTWKEQGVDCIVGAWRGITGATGLAPPQVEFWVDVLRNAVAQPAWAQDLARLSWSPLYQDGKTLRAYLEKERAEFARVLGELGLLRARDQASG